MKKLSILFGVFFYVCSFAQEADSVSLFINYGVSSVELQDFLAFKNIDYYTIRIIDEKIKGKKFVIVSKEYWGQELTRIDTVTDLSKTRIPGLANDSLIITVLTEKSEKDSLKISFKYNRLFGIIKKYHTTELF